jgi:hypothetical protein
MVASFSVHIERSSETGISGQYCRLLDRMSCGISCPSSLVKARSSATFCKVCTHSSVSPRVLPRIAHTFMEAAEHRWHDEMHTTCAVHFPMHLSIYSRHRSTRSKVGKERLGSLVGAALEPPRCRRIDRRSRTGRTEHMRASPVGAAVKPSRYGKIDGRPPLLACCVSADPWLPFLFGSAPL